MLRRNTKQKEIVLRAVSDRHDHPTAEQLYGEIKLEMPDISLATVYRNLGLLADDGKVRRITATGMPDRFDYVTEDHSHFVCVKCGKLIDFPIGDTPTPKLPDCIQVFERQIIYKGVCCDCKTK